AEMTTAQDFSVVDRVSERETKLVAALRFARKNMLGTAGALVVVIMIVMAIFAHLITSYDPTANDFGVMLEAPSHEHLLGTDQYGRDLFARIVFGARTALLVGFLSAFVGATAGL